MLRCATWGAGFVVLLHHSLFFICIRDAHINKNVCTMDPEGSVVRAGLPAVVVLSRSRGCNCTPDFGFAPPVRHATLICDHDYDH